LKKLNEKDDFEEVFHPKCWGINQEYEGCIRKFKITVKRGRLINEGGKPNNLEISLILKK